ncbi:gentisate 1,2-dioxygenase [Lentzea pudingi]|uniref:Gentisate 1,2-dioxygenase n=1 Tax=Lentzea pudingi TaxID=1789439 RepID=A0ABQ2IVM8_9PSEU|nr:cupin domain-containing protein [Lentzea pudingi]GGN28697.1 gentisate 1,2-dioxygenase [Lentzea pudingi]
MENANDSSGPARPDTMEIAYDELCGALAAQDLTGLWRRDGLGAQPTPRTRPHLWQWKTIAPLAKQAGTVVRVNERGDARRALQFCNPGLQMGTTESFFGAYQYLAPGETAPAHRHSPAAIRFVVQGKNVFTTVNGDACEMTPGDLILTPNWAWHDHTNYGSDPIIWFDAIDHPLVAQLESIFFQEHPDGMQEVIGHNVSERGFGAVGLQETSMSASVSSHSPLLRYPYSEVDRTLESLHAAAGGASVTVEYKNPITGGPAIATMTCEMTRVYPGVPTTPQRQAGGRMYVVFRGSGTSVIGGTEFAWSAGDVFVVPSWVPVEHNVSEQSDLFVVGNRAVLEALHLFRKAELDEQQKVTGVFAKD